MHTPDLKKAAILTLILVTAFILCWEYYLRNKGFRISYNDDESLWSSKRAQIDEQDSAYTVFIGSSRIKYDLDIQTWETLTGEKAIQLSFVGTSPRPVLNNLANDPDFNGKLIIDVTEPIFFDRETMRANESAENAIKYYNDRTTAQKSSSVINDALESQFVFLDEEKFGLNALLNHLQIPRRKNVFVFPLFPREFEQNKFNRQNFMLPKFVTDTALQNKQIGCWVILGALDTTPAFSGDSLVAVFEELKVSIDKIKARGGQVLFVRTPSSGGYLETENKVYPREQYWDKMLAYTNIPGVHFHDYEEIAHFICPEWSHLSPEDGIVFTKNFVRILEEEKGWTFSQKTK
ncbi:MAG: hypothetical protein H7Y00_13335 [Fimbriimonadaceae bacterium]|nr:hypothetical protein [Chitinophagales bacterium]